ncbi:MAG: hypothetical protein KKG33_03010 [candidate division Zixibacteria bacterium]|nr:hypothetical protein [candidate division Zixibacteria bacterium]MBU1470728.1 hypothetical protein [candidate division Zixibacteria bacterium]MBU2624512.1 hypothetical protein [candidate division Zixibacteria bacterium]
MLTWCAILLALGVLAFLDSIFSYGEIFRRANSLMFMCVSLGLLVRTASKARAEKKRAAQSGYRLKEDGASDPAREKAGVSV